MVSKNNSKAVLATLALMLLSLSGASSIAIITPHYASAQGVLEGLEREQSDEALPGDQPADIGGAAPLNATTTTEGSGNATNATMTGAAGNATNATMTGAAGNATNATTGGGGTTTGTQSSGPLSLYGGGGGQ
ncbi:MAG TPA: hypothetical protein VIP53_04530 [Nitrososphaera sp.]